MLSVNRFVQTQNAWLVLRPPRAGRLCCRRYYSPLLQLPWLLQEEFGFPTRKKRQVLLLALSAASIKSDIIEKKEATLSLTGVVL